MHTYGMRRNAPLKLADFQEYAAKRGGKLLSTEYVSLRKSRLRWRCAKGHEWEARAANARNGKWCPVCSGYRCHTIEEMRSIALSRGGICLSPAYKANDTRLRSRCARGHEWSTRPQLILNGAWCPTCGSTKHTIEFMRSLAAAHDGECLSPEALGMHTKLLWKCAEGHTWWAKPHSINSRGSWCPACWAVRRKKLLRMRGEKRRRVA
jgi:Zn finger protein HypA/HybF involved in hydrogenase expression